MQNTVAVAAVTFDRPEDVRTLLGALSQQTHAPVSISLVDSGTQPVDRIAAEAQAAVTYLRSEANLGGAGGFSFAILSAMASGAQWVWIMDDDAHPEDPECLATLLAAAQSRGLDVVVPLIVAPGEPTKLSFPFRLDGHLTHERSVVEPLGLIENVGQFFNGALIRTDVFFKVGLPDLRLFIRGDEVDFMLRLRQANVKFGTVTTVALTHPVGWGEVQELMGDRFHVLVPESPFKQFYYYRNRGYLTRKHRRLQSFVADAVGYPLYFLRRGDLKGLAKWAGAYTAGLRGARFGPLKDQKF
ncbi:glycosyl transferase [Arthrobacter livingstonensis]|uniref:Glycosyl transferase n=1 Tax=Arthrobacter livingstonensis TaxID=670078 RepID=A0A2V5LXZ1_9MICC|nr:glycosyltransferase family 2 protein [Arthrobacter livingstonensis]PYI68687.1 glycosyl transferase [Arthrobacter livingstonensis]